VKSDSVQLCTETVSIFQEIPVFWVRSCLYVKSDSVQLCTETVSIFQEIPVFLGKILPLRELDSVQLCTETVSIFQEILRAKSDSGASMQLDRRPMALSYPDGRRLEERSPLSSDARRRSLVPKPCPVNCKAWQLNMNGTVVA
jgi:hypothetical protein